jgi:hypothetical protein
LFKEHAGLIRNNVAKNITNSDFYLKHFSKEPWLDGQGTQYSYPIYERVLPNTPVTFSTWTSSDGTTGAEQQGGQCRNHAGQSLDRFGITLRQTTLKKAALNSPDICLDDLQFAWQVEDQVRNIIRVLTENTRWVWTNAYQDEYLNSIATANCFVVQEGSSSGGLIAAPSNRNMLFAGGDAATYGTASQVYPGVADSKVGRLSWNVLEFIYEQMGYLGGSINPYTRVDEMTPVYALVGDRFSFYDLKMQDSNVRDDFRHAFEGSGNSSPLMMAPGLSGVYRGFKFFTVEFPPRYTLMANDSVASVAVTAGGTGFTSAPAVSFTAAPTGGVTATATATIASGAVTAITITNPGSGYTSNPTVSFTGGGGTSATATATRGTGTWTRVHPFTGVSLDSPSIGRAYEVAQAYKDAPYTDTVVYHADVMKVLIPKPTGVGQLKYNPAYSWSGEFTWRNIQDRTLNPDGSIGFFRALYAYGAKILRPELGFVIRHRRCPRVVEAFGCGGSIPTTSATALTA